MPVIRTNLAATAGNRAANLSKDELLTNCYPELRGQVASVLRRFGYTTVNSYTAAPGLGIFNYNSQAVTVIGSAARLDAASLGTVDATSQYQYTTTGANTGFFLKNDVAAYTYNGSAFTQVTDPDYPAVTVPGVVNIDGFTCVLTQSGRLYNSDVNNPPSFNALNYISLDSSDSGVAVAKYLQYVVTFGQNTTTFFYNNDNSTGSPFLPNKSATLQIGCASAHSVVQTKNTLFWMGQTKNRGRSIYELEGLNPKPISTPFIDRLLSADNLSDVTAYFIELNGHGFYILTLRTSNLTLVYDLQTQVWTNWTSLSLGTPLNVVGTVLTNGWMQLKIPGHGLSNGTLGLIQGELSSQFVGTFLVNVLDADTIVYTPSSGVIATGIDEDTINALEINA